MAVHVYPAEDWIEHHIDGDECTCDCPCEPRVQRVIMINYGYIEERILIIHNQVRPEDPEPEPDSVRWYRRLWASITNFFT